MNNKFLKNISINVIKILDKGILKIQNFEKKQLK